ncbi:MAG TPA: FHA domain-containing protein [Pyrinomonadaceae bacterium]|nr:FHA domain-containing protein [Pyrinomonadaceae bacterium]
MQPQLTLTYYDDAGRLKRASVTSWRFTIGRDPENELVIDRTSLSRRQALIERFDDTFQVSDCGSSNGTFVNGKRVEFPVELHDGDVINLAEVCELEVELSNGQPRASIGAGWANESVPLSHEDMRAIDRRLAAQSSPPVKTAAATTNAKTPSAGGFALFHGLNLRIIGPVVALMILALVAVVVALRGGPSSNGNAPDNRAIIVSSETPNVLTPPATGSAPELPAPVEGASVSSQPRNAIDDELDEVEKNTLIVMRAISLRDSNPVLTQQNDQEIYERIKTYKDSARLRDNLRLMKSRGIQQLTAGARARGIKLPLLVFAGLARVDKDGHGDPVAAAEQMMSELARNQIYLAKDLAHDNLLALAATDPSSGGGMALRDSIAALSKKRSDQGVQAIRNVWYLRDTGILKPPAFDLVMRFLAIGAIAQNPRHFGLDVERLTFDSQ